MSRQFTDAFHNQITNQINSDPVLMLVRLYESPSTVYLVSNTEDIISNGNTYTAFPVDITLAEEDGEQKTQVFIEFDNVSLDLIGAIRTTTDPIPCEIDVVLASNPDVVEMSIKDLLIRNITYDAKKIRATLMQDDFLNSRFPAGSYTPIDYPGIF